MNTHQSFLTLIYVSYIDLCIHIIYICMIYWPMYSYHIYMYDILTYVFISYIYVLYIDLCIHRPMYSYVLYIDIGHIDLCMYYILTYIRSWYCISTFYVTICFFAPQTGQWTQASSGSYEEEDTCHMRRRTHVIWQWTQASSGSADMNIYYSKLHVNVTRHFYDATLTYTKLNYWTAHLLTPNKP